LPVTWNDLHDLHDLHKGVPHTQRKRDVLCSNLDIVDIS
jgi:hypothetical protein